jgi:flagellar biosynthesis chaperone FliJ
MSSSGARIRRAERIVEIRATAVDLLEVEVGKRVRTTAECETDEKNTRDAWEASVSANPGLTCSSADLSEHYAYRTALMRKLELAVSRTKQARADEEAARAKVRIAKTELKKIETWRDRLVEAARADETHRERKAADEVAARIARSA